MDVIDGKNCCDGLDYCRFSVVIPVFNEQDGINSVISDVKAQAMGETCEIIVVDGDVDGGTVGCVEDEGVIGVCCEAGRGRQMNAGAKIAQGEVLLFLHADTRLPDGAFAAIWDAVGDGEFIGGAFELGFDSARFIYRMLAYWRNVRGRLSKVPFGDQGIFIRKDYFERIGGYAEISFLEDVELMRRIKKDGGKIRILGERITTSVRRFEKIGALRGTLRNGAILTMYYLGVSAERLAKYYRSDDGRGK
ncbi:MAG: glycosyltransferase [Planctomycetes bacterium]|nr:glycosyltransferase [Planctomycetota bacterium]